MKRCPQCDRTYPEGESFCEVDGTALVESEGASSPATRPSAPDTEGGFAGDEETPLECPVCGGKAEPGEVMCNFCGARLGSSGPSEFSEPPAADRPSSTTEQVEFEASPRETSRMGGDDAVREHPRRRVSSVIGYSAAALVALAGGIWFALQLSSPGLKPESEPIATPVAVESPAPLPGAPTVKLAATMAIQVTGESALEPERDEEAARRLFDENKGSIERAWERAAVSEDSPGEGMIVRLRILPDGSVIRASVRTSTEPNPGLDAAVVKEMMTWSMSPFSGGQVEIDYPMLFVRDATAEARIEGALRSRLQALAPTESPEYALASEPSPAALASPVAEPSPVARPKPAPKRAGKLASVPKRKPSLLERINRRLAADPKLRRVRAYTNRGTVTLYGKVFDDKDKRLAERTVKRLDGVTGVINTLKTDVAQWAEAQDRITRQLVKAGLNRVTVKVIGRDAYLGGEVKSPLDKQRAVTIAQAAADVRVKTNLIRVKTGSLFGF